MKESKIINLSSTTTTSSTTTIATTRTTPASSEKSMFSSSTMPSHDANFITLVHSDEVIIESVVEVTGADSSVKSAVIVLVLGLILTFTMLIVVGCRLRTMKMRIRRGAAVNSQEADYLINGMYL